MPHIQFSSFQKLCIWLMPLTIAAAIYRLVCRPIIVKFFSSALPTQGIMAGNEDLIHRLTAAHSAIDTVRSFTGNAGLSIGVLHEGKVIHRVNFGYRDVASKIPPDSDTIFHIGSMTKGIIAEEFGVLVQEGKITWDTKLADLVPEFRQSNAALRNPKLATDVNLIDFLAHRLGGAGGGGYWAHKYQILMMEREDTANVIASLEPGDFRSVMSYNNWTYGLLGQLIEKLTGKTAGELAKERFFDPLNLQRTTFGKPCEDNYAISYSSLSNATPYKIFHPPLNDGGLVAAAGCGKSTVNDLLTLYNSVMVADKEERLSLNSSTDKSPFRQISDIFKGYIPITEGAEYGLGWVVTELPAKGGLVGMNAYGGFNGYEGMPLIGYGAPPSTRMIYHNGAMVGALSAVYLFPDSQTAVVALGNSMDLSDTPDWAAQILVNAIFSSDKNPDLVALAKETTDKALRHHPDAAKTLADEQKQGTQSKELSQYTGKYVNDLGNYLLDFTVYHDFLRMAVQGNPRVTYDLYHYHDDVFAWSVDLDRDVREMNYPPATSDVESHKLYFMGIGTGNERVEWAFGGSAIGRDVFTKVSTTRL